MNTLYAVTVALLFARMGFAAIPVVLMVGMVWFIGSPSRLALRLANRSNRTLFQTPSLP